MTRITRELLREHSACYDDARIAGLVPPDGLSLSQVLTLDIPAPDRVWVATMPGVCPLAVLWEWQALLVERALRRVASPDPRSVAVVTLLRRLAAGEDVPQMERAATRADAWVAEAVAWDAATTVVWAATRAAAWDAAAAVAAAAAGAAGAAGAAAKAAEEQQQITDLVRLLAEHEERAR